MKIFCFLAVGIGECNECREVLLEVHFTIHPCGKYGKSDGLWMISTSFFVQKASQEYASFLFKKIFKIIVFFGPKNKRMKRE